MKRILYVLPLLAMAACGGNGGGNSADSDSAAVDSIADSIAAIPRFYLTADSLGPVHVGMKTDSLPEQVEYLYSDMRISTSPDATVNVFDDEGSTRFVTYDFGESRIDVISLSDSVVAVKAPRGDIRMGEEFAKVFELPGVKAEWSGYDSEGMWYWVWEGLWFAPVQEGLDPVLSSRLYNSHQAPTQADFSGNETIGYIATGLSY